MRKKGMPVGVNALPPIFDGIPVIWEDDEFQRPEEEAAYEKLVNENRHLKKELTLARRKLAAAIDKKKHRKQK